MTPGQVGRVWEASEERACRRPALAGVICVGAACATVVVMVVAGLVEAKSGGVGVHGEDGSGSISNPSGERDMKYQHNRSVGALASVAAVGALALAADVCAQQAVQWRVEDGGNGHWYRIDILDSDVSWFAARDLCSSLGGHLATIASEPEYACVLPLVQSATDAEDCYPCVYIGLTRMSGQDWTWIDGAPLTWSIWGQVGDPVEPQGMMAQFSPGGFEPYCVPHLKWNDAAIDALHWMHRGVFTEWSSDCNADGIVDYGQILSGQFTDTNANGIPDICEVDPCPGDVVQTGIVAADDLGSLLAGWGACP